MRYNHTQYAKWGTVYLGEICQIPEVVRVEFERDKFVVKRTEWGFNQVDPDQSQEWMNGTDKKNGGIVGIIKTPSAHSQWTLSYN